MWVGNVVFAQSDAPGALPTLYAATAPGVAGDDYYRPRRHPGDARRPSDAASAGPGGQPTPRPRRRLWEVSEELTGVGFGPLDAVAA